MKMRDRHFALALVVVVLFGCQALNVGHHPQTSPLLNSQGHAQTVKVMNQQMAQYLSEDGRASFLNQMLVALESDKRDKFKGKDPKTYSWWRIRVQPNQWKTAPVGHPIAEGLDTSRALEFMDMPYRSKAKVSLRAEPSFDGQELGVLAKGEEFNAIAKVVEQSWLLVMQNDVIRGYLHKDYARHNVANWNILATPPTPWASHSVETGRSPQHGMQGHYTCRQLSYQLTKEGHITAGSLRACRKQRKIWYIDAPVENSNSS